MKSVSLYVLAFVCSCGVAACSGGGSSGGIAGGGQNGGGPPPTQAPTSSPSPAAITPFAFHIIGPESIRSIGVAPSNSTITLPPGYTYGGAVANAIVTYPDGTSQRSDSNGLFSPSQSPYASKYVATLGTRALAQPVVKVADPQGTSTTGLGIVTPFASASGAAQLGGVTVVPDIAQLFPAELLTLVAVGTDTDDRISELGTRQVNWSSARGATITPIPGTNFATYVAPAVANGITSDTVTAIISGGNGSFAYAATSSVTTIAVSSGVSESGTLRTSGGALMPGGSALFVADDPPRAYPSFNFTALADSSASYRRNLPANSEFTLAISVPSASSPTPGQSVFPAVQMPENDPSLTTGSPGSSGTADLQIGTVAEFDDSKDDAKNAIPDPVVSTRDGWLAEELTRIYPFWADAGVLALLSSSHTDGAAPAPIANGLLARWCYQWQARTGGDTLVLIENAAPACSSPGNEAFEITPQSATSFSLVQYRRLSGPYVLSNPLNDSANALLVLNGNWSQNVVMNGTRVASDTANVTLQFYGPVSQTPSAPVSKLVMQYAYSSSGGAPNVTISNATLSDPAAGLSLATASGSLTQSSAPSSCVGTPAPCYIASMSVTRNYALSIGSASRSFSTQDTLNGDGSATHSTKSLLSGDASAVTFPIGSVTARAAGSCIVCASKSGSQLDVDGLSQLGLFTVPAIQIASFNLLSTVEGEAPGMPVAELTFPL